MYESWSLTTCNMAPYIVCLIFDFICKQMNIGGKMIDSDQVALIFWEAADFTKLKRHILSLSNFMYMVSLLRVTLTISGKLHWHIHAMNHQIETFSALLALCAGNSPVKTPHKGQWRGALMFSLICIWTSGWVNSRDAGNMRRHRADYDVTVMVSLCGLWVTCLTSHFWILYYILN